MKRSMYYIVFSGILLFLMLSGCSNDEDGTAGGSGNDAGKADDGEVEAEPQPGGAVTGAMFAAPSGMFNPLFYEESHEANILDFTHEALFVQNDNLEFEANLAQDDWELNDDQTELTVHLQEDVTWHDGEDFTADDVVFTYQTMADPDYIKAGGVRSNYVIPLRGYEAYVEGETDDFEGVEALDEQTVVFHFTEPQVTPEYIASFPIIPEHIFEDIPVANMPQADESRESGAVIGTGPFQFTEMVEREQYVLEKYTDYWQAEPYLDKVTWKVIEQSELTESLETGDIDFVATPGGIAPIDYEMVEGFNHINTLEQTAFHYQLLGFKLNHRTTEDVEAGNIHPDDWVPNDKLPKEVRQAIAYAVDRESLIGEQHGEGLLHGKGVPIDSPIAPSSWAYDDEASSHYTYDPDKAADILDEAGYELGSDGFRTDPDGNEWILNMDYPAGNDLRERAAPLIKDDLEEVGIQVNLREPQDMSAYVSELTDDDTDWDLYLIGWNFGSHDPDPLGLWGIDDVYNFSRWNNPDSDELLYKALETPDAFKQDFRAEIYTEWQQLFSEDLPALLLFAPNSLWGYNDRLHGVVPLPHTMYHNPHLWWVDDGEE